MTPTTSTPATFLGNRVDQQFIAGQWRDGATGQRKTDINPYTDDVVAEFTLATEEDLDEAYRAAAEKIDGDRLYTPAEAIATSVPAPMAIPTSA